jgi:hypothetical protein
MLVPCFIMILVLVVVVLVVLVLPRSWCPTSSTSRLCDSRRVLQIQLG